MNLYTNKIIYIYIYIYIYKVLNECKKSTVMLEFHHSPYKDAFVFLYLL